MKRLNFLTRQDHINSLDLIDMREELEEELEALEEEESEAREAYRGAGADEIEAAAEALTQAEEEREAWEEENLEALDELVEACENAETYISGWGKGVVLIAEDAFEEYAQEWAAEIGALQEVKWPYTHVDWESAAEELKFDYVEISINGRYYLGRM